MRATIALFLIRLMSRLPLRLVQGLGSLLGTLFYWFPNRERRTAEVNLRLCFPDLDDRERDRLMRSCLRENAKTLAEAAGAWLREPSYWLKRTDPTDREQVFSEALAKGKGVILAAPHLGNWEIGVHSLVSVAPITVLYRPPRQKWLEELIVSGRAQSGAKLVPTNAQGVKALFSALRKGEMVAILPDQQPKKSESKAGVFAPFFGVPALTMVLINRLARKTGAVVVYVFAERLTHGRGFRMHWIKAPEALADPDPVAAATALNQGVEQCVRHCPEQYQWSYRRFEARPDGGRSPYSRNKSHKS